MREREGRVLVTGANGFVGSRMAARLLSLGSPVRTIVRRPTESPAVAGSATEEIVGDFVDRETAARAAKGCAAVIHAAATAGPDREAVRRVNAEGTRAMVEAALAAGAERFIQISTISVYDMTGRDVVDEEAPLKVTGDPYSTTKAEADGIVAEAATRGLRMTIFRPGAILGVHPTSTWGVKVPGRIRDRAIKLLGEGRNTHPFIHVEDLVDAVLGALERNESFGRAYNVVEKNGTWKEYTDEVRSWFGTAPLGSVPEAEASAMTDFRGVFSAERLKGELGWSPKRAYAEGMAEAERYWRQAAAASAV